MAFARYRPGSGRSHRQDVAARVGIFIMLMAVSLAWTHPAEGQLVDSDRLSISPTGGVAVITGDMADFVGHGPSFGLQVMYELVPRILLGLDFAHDSHDAAARDLRVSPNTMFTGPPFRVLRYGLSVEGALLPPEPGRISLAVSAGAGLATFFSEAMYNPFKPHLPFHHSDELLRFDGTYPAFNGGVRLGYVASNTISLFVEGLVFTTGELDEDKAIIFSLGAPGFIQSGGQVIPAEAATPPQTMRSIGLRLGFRKSL